MTSTAVPRIAPIFVAVPVSDGAVDVAEIALPGVPRGAVIILCEPAGLGERATELMNGLAEHGYSSLVADVTGRSGQIDDDRSLEIVAALVAYLAGRGWSDEQIGLVGYGSGGRAALLASGIMKVGAAVSISPNGLAHTSDGGQSLAAVAQPVITPWLGMFGERDENAIGDAVRELERALTDPSPAYTEIVTYPGVDGEFYRESAEALGHAAMFDSWQRVIEWLNLRVVPRPTPFAEIWALRQSMYA